MSPLPRRCFLSGLVGLPLIGGGITLIGKPTGTAVPVTHALLQAYDEWLFMERRMLLVEQYGRAARDRERFRPVNTLAGNYHDPSGPDDFRIWHAPSTRAAVILNAAGVGLREPA